MKKSVRLFSLLIVLVLLLSTTVVSVGAKPSGTVNVQILAVNDFRQSMPEGQNTWQLTLMIYALPIPILWLFQRAT